MAPLIALLGGFGVLRLIGFAGIPALDGWQPALRGALALMFLLTGLAHFTKRRQGLIDQVPPSLPRPDLLVTVTGVLELAGVAGLLLPATASAAAWCLFALMVPMFTANVSAARRGLPVTPLVPRTAMEIVFLAAAVGAAI